MKSIKKLGLGLVALMCFGGGVMPTTTFSSVNQVKADSVIPKVPKGKKGIYLKEGQAYTAEGKLLDRQRGKFSWAVKAIRAALKRLPGWLKVGGFETVLSVVEHYTGWLEDAIYWGYRSAGYPDWFARPAAKTIMFFVF